MKRHTQVILYHLLPVVFWLLAIGGSLVPLILRSGEAGFAVHYLWSYLVAAIVMLCFLVVGRVRRHESSVEQCFLVAILLSIASFWLPSVLFVILPVWIYLIYRNIFDLRSFVATLLGFALVAVWVVLFIYLGWLSNPWAQFFAKESAYGWIPVGAIFIAWFASTIARQNLRVR
ncbi:MAG: hypothetical protein J6T80_08225 [Paludibacteraceae bacterium]|nr:hypothetical protein [Paludibacteraceae bacterium]